MIKSQGGRTALWVIGHLLWVFAILVGLQYLLGLLIVKIFPANLLDSTLANVLYLVVSYILIVLVIIVLPPKIFKGKVEKVSREKLGLRGFPTWTDIGLAPIGYVVSLISAAGLTAFFRIFPWFNSEEAQNLGYSLYMMGWERGLAFIGLAVFAPIIEELIFRGWLYGKLRIKIPKWLAIILVSLLFGLVHLQWNIGITVFCMSVISCILREVTGTIYAGTLLHILSNGIAFYIRFVMGIG